LLSTMSECEIALINLQVSFMGGVL
jgi:hypothetical protein